MFFSKKAVHQEAFLVITTATQEYLKDFALRQSSFAFARNFLEYFSVADMEDFSEGDTNESLQRAFANSIHSMIWGEVLLERMMLFVNDADNRDIARAGVQALTLSVEEAKSIASLVIGKLSPVWGTQETEEFYERYRRLTSDEIRTQLLN